MTYDALVDVAYIYVDERDPPAAMTYACDPAVVNGQIHLDFDADGRLIGTEILDASRLLPAHLISSREKP